MFGLCRLPRCAAEGACLGTEQELVDKISSTAAWFSDLVGRLCVATGELSKIDASGTYSALTRPVFLLVVLEQIVHQRMTSFDVRLDLSQDSECMSHVVR